MGVFKVTIKGEGLAEASAALERADIPAHDQGRLFGSTEILRPRIVATLEADTAEGAEARVREVLPQSAYKVTVKPA